jgi:predicted Zn-dependent protease
MFRFLMLAPIAAMLMSGCATDPDGKKVLILVDDKQMTALGLSAFDELKAKTPVSANPAIQNYVQCVTRRLINELPPEQNNQAWEVVVFEDPTPNAFALPGGKVGVHTGLLNVAQTEDQLAAVIGHELAHVTYKHGSQRVSQQLAVQTASEVANAYMGANGQQRNRMVDAAIGIGAQVGILLPFSRKHETQADKAGQLLMARAGYDPAQASQLWMNMMAASKGSPPKWLSTHPDPEQRMTRLGERAPDLLPLMESARAQGKTPGCR